MSVDLVVYAARSAMPSTSQWAQSIVAAGFAAELDDDFDIDSFSGFLPCSYGGEEAGFEYFAGPVEASEVELPSECDFSITFSTHSELRELAASVAAAATLCSLTQGVLYDAQAGTTVPASEVQQWAREQLLAIGL
jgi:hypothetical protein